MPQHELAKSCKELENKMGMPRAQQGTPCRETFLPESFIFLLALLILAVTISKRCNERGEQSRVFVLWEGGVVSLGSHAPFCLVQGWFLLPGLSASGLAGSLLSAAPWGGSRLGKVALMGTTPARRGVHYFIAMYSL